APTFELAVLARFVSGLPHGAYFGIAGLAAADLMGPGMRGRGAASVLLGLAVSNVLGVPLITAIGHATSWRVAVLTIAAIFAVATIAIALTLPRGEHGPGTSIRTELSALRRPGVWIAVAIGSIGFAGFFAVYSTVASLTTEVAGLPATAVPWLLAVVGLGMTAGNLLGGRLADGGAIRTLIGLMPVFSVLLAGTALLAPFPIPLTIGLFLIGTVGSVMVPSVQVRLMDVAGDAHTLAAALNHSALNIGNAIGAAVAGALISWGWGFVSPLWAGALLGLVGFLCAWLSRAVEGRSRR
ncbi:arabinose ABC transporter permease, partial [Leucobacter sp. OLCS4]